MTEHLASQLSTAGWAGEGLFSSSPSWCHELLSSTLLLLTQHCQPQLIRMDLSLTQSSPKSLKSFPLRLQMWLHQHWERDSHTTNRKELGLVDFFWGRDAMGWVFSLPLFSVSSLVPQTGCFMAPVCSWNTSSSGISSAQDVPSPKPRLSKVGLSGRSTCKANTWSTREH